MKKHIFAILCVIVLPAIMLIDSVSGNISVPIPRLGRVSSEITSEQIQTELGATTGNTCLSFKGSTGYVTFADTPVLDVNTGDFSICGWFNTFNDGKYLISKYSGTVGYYVRVSTAGSAGKVHLVLCDGVSTAKLFQSDSVISNGWHHIAATVDRNGNGTMYVDGVASTPVAIGGNTLTVANATAFLIGKYSSTYYSGLADDIRLYKSLLTAAEVLEIYNSGVGLKYAALLTGTVASAAWDCDEVTGTTITDTVGSLEGTLTGGVSFVGGGRPYYTLGSSGAGTGDVTLAGNQTFTTGTKVFTVLPRSEASPSDANQLATKAYVDSLICIPDPNVLSTADYTPLHKISDYIIPQRVKSMFYDNAGDSNAINFTLPDATLGPDIEIRKVANYTMTITCDTGDFFNDDSATVLTNSTNGYSTVLLKCVVAGRWIVIELY